MEIASTTDAALAPPSRRSTKARLARCRRACLGAPALLARTGARSRGESTAKHDASVVSGASAAGNGLLGSAGVLSDSPSRHIPVPLSADPRPRWRLGSSFPWLEDGSDAQRHLGLNPVPAQEARDGLRSTRLSLDAVKAPAGSTADGGCQ
ncbi:hypothetical protein CVO74_16150 [Xanthomonas prunicola]|uniref:Uncharacterized protein n=1 Tax=Xanthomonas prunicola TaxID=2053930 RepID=A0A2N3RH03_9XANT|nr:hypothetical protein XpruCFBP8353_16405 [Xanthomonas prunicola]PKV16007.1 hypothetical protein XpruCFBP8354_16020 [Xanthomonas prunicola]PKV20270.1 hypothetical protein CVO74_16150 [Xanthomonas prunicola]